MEQSDQKVTSLKLFCFLLYWLWTKLYIGILLIKTFPHWPSDGPVSVLEGLCDSVYMYVKVLVCPCVNVLVCLSIMMLVCDSVLLYLRVLEC